MVRIGGSRDTLVRVISYDLAYGKDPARWYVAAYLEEMRAKGMLDGAHGGCPHLVRSQVSQVGVLNRLLRCSANWSSSSLQASVVTRRPTGY